MFKNYYCMYIIKKFSLTSKKLPKHLDNVDYFRGRLIDGEKGQGPITLNGRLHSINVKGDSNFQKSIEYLEVVNALFK